MVSVEVILVVVSTLIIAIYYLRTRQNTPKHLKQQVLDYEQLLKLKVKESNQWKGKFNAREKGPVMQQGDAKDMELEDVIPELAKGYIPNAPRWLKPLLSNPDVVKYAVKLAKEHPDQAKQLLGKFVGKKISGDTIPEEVSGL